MAWFNCATAFTPLLADAESQQSGRVTLALGCRRSVRPRSRSLGERRTRRAPFTGRLLRGAGRGDMLRTPLSPRALTLWRTPMTERNQARDAERLPETAARRLLERASELGGKLGSDSIFIVLLQGQHQ